MILSADTPMSEMSSFMLKLIIEDAEEELRKRKVDRANAEMTKVWKAIENFQKCKYEDTYLFDVNENRIRISEIAEIYDYENDCGFAFGPWTED